MSKKNVILISLFILFLIFQTACNKEPEQVDPPLIPHIERLAKELSEDEQKHIAYLDESELWSLHFGLGLWIRNNWLRGNRNPPLIAHYKKKGITHPDDQSQDFIHNLWLYFNSKLTNEEKKQADESRMIVREKRKTIETIEHELEDYLVQCEDDFIEIYEKYKNPIKSNAFLPFWIIVVAHTGEVKEIYHTLSQKSKGRNAIESIIRKFRFTPFSRFSELTLYIVRYPHCRVKERYELFSW